MGQRCASLAASVDLVVESAKVGPIELFAFVRKPFSNAARMRLLAPVPVLTHHSGGVSECVKR